MPTKLDDLSVAIGALQEGQRRAEQWRVEQAREQREQAEKIARKLVDQDRVQAANFEAVNEKLAELTISIDNKVEKAAKRIFHGSLGGAGIVFLQYVANHLGIKFPFDMT